MKYPSLILCLTLPLLIACSGSDNRSSMGAEAQEKMIAYRFSDTLALDTFRLRIDGSKPKEMQLLFTVTAHNGNLIYSAAIKASDLFMNYDATLDLAKKKNQIKFLKEEMERFFDEENFMEPAVTEQEKADEHVPDAGFFAELKSNGLNGFTYRLGKENKVYIAWSETDKAVKPYYICCK